MTDFVIGIDPATSSGLVLARYGEHGMPVLVDQRLASFSRQRRAEWSRVARTRLSGMTDMLPANDLTGRREAVVLIEDWDRHSSYNAAVRLAQVQQCWIDVAADLGFSVGLVKVMKWQVATGVNKFTDRKTGKGSRKRAAIRYAASSFKCGVEGCGKRLDECDHMRQKSDIGDAMCMVRYWIDQGRLKAATLPF